MDSPNANGRQKKRDGDRRSQRFGIVEQSEIGGKLGNRIRSFLLGFTNKVTRGIKDGKEIGGV